MKTGKNAGKKVRFPKSTPQIIVLPSVVIRRKEAKSGRVEWRVFTVCAREVASNDGLFLVAVIGSNALPLPLRSYQWRASFAPVRLIPSAGSNLSDVRMIEESQSMKDACKIMLEPLTNTGRIRTGFGTSLLEEARAAGRGESNMEMSALARVLCGRFLNYQQQVVDV